MSHFRTLSSLFELEKSALLTDLQASEQSCAFAQFLSLSPEGNGAGCLTFILSWIEYHRIAAPTAASNKPLHIYQQYIAASEPIPVLDLHFLILGEKQLGAGIAKNQSGTGCQPEGGQLNYYRI